MHHIVLLYCVRFSKPVLASILIGCPAALIIVFRWIEQFPYQLGKAGIALISFGAAAFILLLAWMMVSALIITVLRRKPSRVLRYE
jgi:hypothetical protein